MALLILLYSTRYLQCTYPGALLCWSIASTGASHLLVHCICWCIASAVFPLTAATASKRVRSSGRVPIAAPQRSCLLSSFVANGKSRFLMRSVRDINATS